MGRNKSYTEEKLIEILKSVGKENVAKKDIDKNPNIKCGSMTIIRHFGSWAKALDAANLKPGIKTGRKLNGFKVGEKILKLEKYTDDHVFFSKQEVWEYNKAHTDEEVMQNVVLPFVKFIRKYEEKFGWIYPDEPTDSDWGALLKTLKSAEPKIYSSSPIGMKEIKGYFKSFWDATTKRKAPSTGMLRSDGIVKLMAYRFGLGNSKNYKYVFSGEEVEWHELFDISLKQIRRSLEVNRHSVSLFKPILAKYIYQTYGFEGMTTWDPCAGFAGRMLGFLAAFDNGKYIANEPNEKLHRELVSLAQTLTADTLEFYNLPLEGSEIPDESIDLCFTCPPYFDKEHYCDDGNQSDVKYSTYDSWKEGFLRTLMRKCRKSLKKGGKCVIVFDKVNADALIDITSGLRLVKSTPIKNNKTHLTGSENYEQILVFEKQ